MVSVHAPVYDAEAVARLLQTARRFPLAAPPEPLPGFVTFFDPGLSILELRDGLGGRGIFARQPWYDREQFACALDAPCYRQLRMGLLEGSLGKSYWEQLPTLPAEERQTKTRVVVTALVVHYLATGERLLPNVNVRCTDYDRSGLGLYVGNFGSEGFKIGSCRDETRLANLGLISARALLNPAT